MFSIKKTRAQSYWKGMKIFQARGIDKLKFIIPILMIILKREMYRLNSVPLKKLFWFYEKTTQRGKIKKLGN